MLVWGFKQNMMGFQPLFRIRDFFSQSGSQKLNFNCWIRIRISNPDPDPDWRFESGSNRIRIRNTGYHAMSMSDGTRYRLRASPLCEFVCALYDDVTVWSTFDNITAVGLILCVSSHVTFEMGWTSEGSIKNVTGVGFLSCIMPKLLLIIFFPVIK